MDATIAQLENIRAVVTDSEIAANESIKEALKHDLYLVSHPLTQNNGNPSDYTTYNITLSQLFDQLSAITYDAVFSKINADLNLGDFAHINLITDPSQVRGNTLSLEQHIRGYGPLAREWQSWPTLSIDKDTDKDSDIYEKARQLGLGYLAHKDYIASADLSSKLAPSQIDGSKGYDGLIVSALSDLDLHDLAHTTLSDLYLSSLAHGNVVSANELKVFPGQIQKQIDFATQISGWEDKLNQHYLSAPKKDGTTYGSIKLGYSETTPSESDGNRQYALSIDSYDKAFVKVPWKYRSENLSVNLSAGSASSNTIALTYTRQIDENGRIVSTQTSSIPVTLNPYIASNVTYVGEVSNLANKVAVFTSNGKLSAAGALISDTSAFYRANGTFSQIRVAGRDAHGLMSKADYSYLYDLTSNLPEATEHLYGAVKIGYNETSENRAVRLDDGKMYVTMPENVAATSSTFGHVKIGFSKSGSNIPVQLNSSGQMFVDVPQLEKCTTSELGGIKVGYSRAGNNIPIKVDGSGNAYAEQGYATASQLGSIKTGYAANGSNYPVQVDREGNAFVNVNINLNSSSSSSSGSNSSIIGDIIDSLYPVGALYITANPEHKTCPLAKFKGTWEKITGRYLLASGQFASTGSGINIRYESYKAGDLVEPALPSIPSHTHDFSFRFSSGNSKDGYPQHGGGSYCNHGSNIFTTSGASATSNAIYGQSGGVRPRSLVVNVFKRTA